MRRVRVGLAQVNPTVGAIEANARLVIEWMGRARAAGCDLVAFPELTLTGYPPEDLLFKPAFIEANLRALADVTKESRGLTAVLGYVDKRDDIFNAAAVLHDGAHAGTYHKQYLPNYGVFDENRYFQSGTESPIFAAGDVTLAANICEDIWYPTGPTTRQALAGAELIVTINASPYHVGKAQFREKMLATRASDDVVCLAFVNMVGGQDELVFDGHSFVFNEKGECLARGKAFEEDLVIADVDLDQVFRARLLDSRRRKEKLQADQSTRRISLPTLPAKDKPKLPVHEVEALEPLEEIYRALVLGTRDYVTKNGFAHVVIGLSGGIDSSIVDAVAVEALGAANVSGVTMPSPYSSAGTRRDAVKLAKNLGIDLLRVPITGVLKAYKRELAVGYTTLYGDMAGGFAVIKDCPKTLVYKLSEHANARAGREIIPRTVFTRPPSAELRPGQKDQDSLPPYEELDAILACYVEGDQAVADIVARGFDVATVKRVVAMVDRNEYKRRQGAIGIKITPRAFGKDWRLPIVNKFRE